MGEWLDVPLERVTRILLGGTWMSVEPGSFEIAAVTRGAVAVATQGEERVQFACRSEGFPLVGWLSAIEAVRYLDEGFDGPNVA